MVNAEVVRCKPRLLAFLGHALPDGPTRLRLESQGGRSVPVLSHEAAETGPLSRMAVIVERWSRLFLAGEGSDARGKPRNVPTLKRTA